jgi:hypothetical protein
VVIEYLRDFANAEQWDPGTEQCVRTDGSGPIVVGSKWHNTSKIAGSTTELDHTPTDLQPDRLVFVGENDTVTTTECRHFSSSDAVMLIISANSAGISQSVGASRARPGWSFATRATAMAASRQVGSGLRTPERERLHGTSRRRTVTVRVP